MNSITQLLDEIEAGDTGAMARLWPLVYEELRRLAAARLAREKPGQTLQATALVHEAYLALIDGNYSWQSRAHFFAAAAEAMRRILINKAVRKRRPKHGGDLKRIDFDDVAITAETDTLDIEALDQALTRLQAQDSEAAEVVKLKYFAGLTIPEIAEVLQLSVRSVDRRWAYARAWLHRELKPE